VGDQPGSRLKITLLGLALAGLIVGLALRLKGTDALARAMWIAGVAPVLASMLLEILRSLRHGEVGLDIVTALSISAALLLREALTKNFKAMLGRQVADLFRA
jgi:hypothetical protein